MSEQMIKPLYKKDTPVLTEDGEVLCRFACDVYYGDIVQVEHFKDWNGKPPKVGDELHPEIKRLNIW